MQKCLTGVFNFDIITRYQVEKLDRVKKVNDQEKMLKENGVSDNMAENVRLLQLWDTYKGLLTERQQQVLDLFFNYDFSLSEIANETGVSRQSVSDCITKCKKQLEKYEEKLGHFQAIQEMNHILSTMMTNVGRWIDQTSQTHPELKEELSKLGKMIETEN